MKKNHLYYVLIIVVFSSCSSKRDLIYFSDLKEKSIQNSVKFGESDPKIQEDDLLYISINTPSAESNLLFTLNSNNSSKSNTDLYEKESYRVDKNGSIKLPVIGNLPLKGLTIEQAQQSISKKLESYVKNSIVTVRLLNFQITVIGEVNRPSTFTLADENVDLLQALGMAGDMTPYGKRDNVLIIRKEDGKRSMVRLNLNKGDVLNSPYFYLKQNDVVYVESDKSKALEYSPNNRLMPLFVATISAIAVLATTLLSN